MAAASTREPRSTPRLIGETFKLYWRYPLLFLILAAGVVVPYQLIVLATTGTTSVNHRGVAVGISLLLTLIDWAVVDPLVSALHVRAVEEVEEGRTPRLGPVARQGLAVLPMVAAAVIMSWLAIAGGFLLLVLPGIYVFVRLTVTAQAAAIERQGWLPALRRSWALTEGNLLHVAFFFVCVSLITVPPGLLLHHILGEETTALTFVAGLAWQVVVISFDALATAILYFDLRARRLLAAEEFTGRRRAAPE